MDDSTISIKNCPHCKGTHTYNLEVERAYLMRKMTAFDSFGEAPRKVPVTRIFVCPVNNEQYQGRFFLYETSDTKIQSVNVKGITNG